MLWLCDFKYHCRILIISFQECCYNAFKNRHESVYLYILLLAHFLITVSVILTYAYFSFSGNGTKNHQSITYEKFMKKTKKHQN